MEEITYLEKPDLYQPYLIIGFEGWPNAAEVSSFSIEYLVDHLNSDRKILSTLFFAARGDHQRREVDRINNSGFSQETGGWGEEGGLTAWFLTHPLSSLGRGEG